MAIEALAAAPADIANAILVAYATTAEDVRELRDIIVATLSKNPALCDNQEIGNAVCSINGLAWELFRKSKEVPATIEPVGKALCRDCKQDISDRRVGVYVNRYCASCSLRH